MSRKATKINITEAQRASLENGYRNGKSHAFRMRCLMVLGKADGRSNAAAGERAGATYQRIMHWANRFLEQGIDGLKTSKGRGRKRIIQKADEQAVRYAITQHRQSVSKAKAAFEKATRKSMCEGTFRNFLSALTQDLDV